MKFTASIVALLAAPARALQGGYLSQMGGGGAVKASTLKPAGSANPAFGASYLDNMGGNAVPATPAATGSVFSLSELVDDSATAAAAGEYLTSLKVAAAPSGSGPVGYLDALRTQAFESAATNLPGYLDTLTVSASTVTGGLGPATYLDNIAGAATVAARVEAATEVTIVSSEPILAAINQMQENMNKNQEATIEILQDINSSMKQLVTAARVAPAQPAAAAPVQAAPVDAPAPAAGDYLSHLNGASVPTGPGLVGYLDSLPSTELTFALEGGGVTGASVAAGDYLSSLR
ncbi:expressed unknown protein [Seminavis robusta]|uniref:Uncharacterized protein n=1 Tax=Seminavis robusta TaxID=568900 RepID=A0A9N8E311_9STRA|nr:expressed unknown protein [Seminavis robusta]|eukprot:Sro453_g145980.1 n/a (290) ;mRNA; r:3069-3938